jgi:hypothetical protein
MVSNPHEHRFQPIPSLVAHLLKEVAGAISFFQSSKVAIAVRPMVCLFALRLSCVALPPEVS